MRWNFAHILNKSLIRPISYENSLWSLSKTKVFEAQTFVQLGCEFIQNMAKFQCIIFGCLFIFYHIFKIYSWPTYNLKFRMLHLFHNKYIPESSPYPQQMYINNKKEPCTIPSQDPFLFRIFLFMSSDF